MGVCSGKDAITPSVIESCEAIEAVSSDAGRKRTVVSIILPGAEDTASIVRHGRLHVGWIRNESNHQTCRFKEKSPPRVKDPSLLLPTLYLHRLDQRFLLGKTAVDRQLRSGNDNSELMVMLPDVAHWRTLGEKLDSRLQAQYRTVLDFLATHGEAVVTRCKSSGNFYDVASADTRSLYFSLKTSRPKAAISLDKAAFGIPEEADIYLFAENHASILYMPERDKNAFETCIAELPDEKNVELQKLVIFLKLFFEGGFGYNHKRPCSSGHLPECKGLAAMGLNPAFHGQLGISTGYPYLVPGSSIRLADTVPVTIGGIRNMSKRHGRYGLCFTRCVQVWEEPGEEELCFSALAPHGGFYYLPDSLEEATNLGGLVYAFGETRETLDRTGPVEGKIASSGNVLAYASQEEEAPEPRESSEGVAVPRSPKPPAVSVILPGNDDPYHLMRQGYLNIQWERTGKPTCKFKEKTPVPLRDNSMMLPTLYLHFLDNQFLLGDTDLDDHLRSGTDNSELIVVLPDATGWRALAETLESQLQAPLLAVLNFLEAQGEPIVSRCKVAGCLFQNYQVPLADTTRLFYALKTSRPKATISLDKTNYGIPQDADVYCFAENHVSVAYMMDSDKRAFETCIAELPYQSDEDLLQLSTFIKVFFEGGFAYNRRHFTDDIAFSIECRGIAAMGITPSFDQQHGISCGFPFEVPGNHLRIADTVPVTIAGIRDMSKRHKRYGLCFTRHAQVWEEPGEEGLWFSCVTPHGGFFYLPDSLGEVDQLGGLVYAFGESGPAPGPKPMDVRPDDVAARAKAKRKPRFRGDRGPS